MDLRQIDDVTVSRLDLVAHLMEAGRWREARKAVSAACSEHHSAHDGYRNSVARVLSLIVTEWGQAAVEEFREAHGAWPDFQPLCDESFRTQVEIVAGVNHMHLASFRLIEDSSKVTLLYEPCGSGARLINDGAYYGTREYPLTLMRQPSNSTFGEKDFPVYCNHCSEMTGTILANGGSCFLVEGWTTDHRYGGCRMHVFKSWSAVPDEFFHRTGVDRNEVPEKKSTEEEVPSRVFTEEELQRLARPIFVRLEEAIEDRNPVEALKLVALCNRGWRDGLYPAYRLWLSNLYDGVRRQYGRDALDSVFSGSIAEFYGPVLAASANASQSQIFCEWSDLWRSISALEDLEMAQDCRRLVVNCEHVLEQRLSVKWDFDWVQVMCTVLKPLGLHFDRVPGDKHRIFQKFHR